MYHKYALTSIHYIYYLDEYRMEHIESTNLIFLLISITTATPQPQTLRPYLNFINLFIVLI